MQLLNFLPVSFFSWCENVPPGLWIRNAKWAFAIIETVHIMALTVLLGTLIVVDLRLLGFGMRRQSAAYLARLLAPWTWSALLTMVVTGIGLFASEANRLSQSGPFAFKMLLLVLAVGTHFTIHSRVTRNGITSSAGIAKAAACLSIALWLGVALAGRAIPFL
jgi:uncharacterized membrane protein